MGPAPFQRIAVAVVLQGERVLVGRRGPGGPLPGKAEFPGGKIRPGETPQEAACRECREETGLAVEVLRPLQVVRHRYEHGAVELHFLLARPLPGQGKPRGGFAWVPCGQLAGLDFPEANAPVLQWLQAHATDQDGK